MSSDKTKVLIFGINGFVGGYLTREFLEHGYEVYGSDIAEAATSEDVAVYFQGDITNTSRVNDIVSSVKPSMIVNLAAISSVSQSWRMPQTTMEVNVVGALNVMEAARKQEQLPKILLVGSSEEYAASDKPLSEEGPLDAGSPYGISKIAQERFAEIYEKEYGLKIYRTRSFNHTGPGQAETFVIPSWCKQIVEIEKSGKPGTIKVGNIDIYRDFSDVRDIVRAYRILLESDYSGEVFNIGSGKAYKLEEIIRTLSSFSEQDIEIEVCQERIRSNDVRIIQSSNERFRAAFGYEIESDMNTLLSDIFNSFYTAS